MKTSEVWCNKFLCTVPPLWWLRLYYPIWVLILRFLESYSQPKLQYTDHSQKVRVKEMHLKVFPGNYSARPALDLFFPFSTVGNVCWPISWNCGAVYMLCCISTALSALDVLIMTSMIILNWKHCQFNEFPAGDIGLPIYPPPGSSAPRGSLLNRMNK